MLGVLLAAAVAAATPTAFETQCRDLAASEAPPAERLHKLFEATWGFLMSDSPQEATEKAVPGQDHRWRDVSPEAAARRARELEASRRALATIPRDDLEESDRLNRDLFERSLDWKIEELSHPYEYVMVNQLGGVQLDAEQTISQMAAGSVPDYETVLARLRSLPAFIDQTIGLLRRGLAAGITTPRVVMEKVPEQVGAQIVEDPRKSPLLGAFDRFPEAVGPADRERLTGEAHEVYRKQVRPAFERLLRFLTETYLPKTRTSLALTAVPGGEAWYAFNLRYATTTSLSPREIHDLGVAEVARIKAEMEEVAREAGATDLPSFVRRLQQDPSAYHTATEAFLAEYRDIAKRVDPEVVKLFRRLPRLPYGVVALAASAAPSGPAGYYVQGTLDGGRPGLFHANTHDLASRPRWAMEPLVLHEAVPGHHLQIALAQELEGVPEFRKHGFPNDRRLGYLGAFVEGWALYAEALGPELGLYRTPETRFGRLSNEMWRAVRLVVDTGLHAFGWSRERAITYFAENTGKPVAEATVEVDRYIVWPGQAAAYKIGEIRIRELRAHAQAELGTAFDVRAFHDAVLEAGALPLDLLETRIKAWVAARKPAPPAASGG